MKNKAKVLETITTVNGTLYKDEIVIFEGKEKVKSRPPPPKNPLTKMPRSVMSK